MNAVENSGCFFAVCNQPLELQLACHDTAPWLVSSRPVLTFMKNPNTHELAAEAVRHAGGSAPVSQVIDYILKRKSYHGRTPRNTLSAALRRSKRVTISRGICRLR